MAEPSVPGHAAVGPLVAGAVWGLVGLVVLLSHEMLWQTAEMFGGQFRDSVMSFAGVLLPAIGVALVGTEVAGRWRAPSRGVPSGPSGSSGKGDLPGAIQQREQARCPKG